MTATRRAIATLALAATLGPLAACSTQEKQDQPRRPDPTSESADPTSGAGAGGETGAAVGETSAPAPDPIALPVGKTVTDPELGHSITIKEVVRHAPLPEGNTSKGELVGVHVQWKAGDRYTASLRPDMIVVGAGAQKYAANTALTTVATSAANQKALGVTEVAQSGDGWLYFLVGPDAKDLTAIYRRPPTSVSDTEAAIPMKDFPVALPNP